MIIFDDVSKSYDGERFVLKELSFQIPSGSLFVIMGASGSGKSTIIKLMNRLLEATSGKIIINHNNINNQSILQLRRSLGYVFQKVGLFPHMTVAENIAVVLKHQRKSKHISQKIAELLSQVNLEPAIFSNRYPKTLSGGEQQRVGIARALAMDTDIILMDEPFSALDAVIRTTMQQEIQLLQKKLGKTIVLVTHDLFEALNMADHIAILNNGILEEIDTPTSLLTKTSSDTVKQLLDPFKKQILSFHSQITLS